MRLIKIIVGELVVLAASVLVFRSLWTMLDQYFGYAHLEIMLVIGIVVTVLGLILLNHEVKCELEKTQKH
ncbi:MAG: hypothetical protein ACQCN5_10300 [Candidatus Bathyarchaeia archaeon]|jgi:hypothetical protein